MMGWINGERNKRKTTLFHFRITSKIILLMFILIRVAVYEPFDSFSGFIFIGPDRSRLFRASFFRVGPVEFFSGIEARFDLSNRTGPPILIKSFSNFRMKGLDLGWKCWLLPFLSFLYIIIIESFSNRTSFFESFVSGRTGRVFLVPKF